jgi:integrase
MSDSSHTYVFQLYGDSEIYDTYEKAHKRLCNLVKKNDDDFKPYKTEKHKGGLALSENILHILRIYYKKYKPSEYLFNGQNKTKYSSSSCNKIVKKHIGESYSFHSLRHSCFTHLTEQNIDIRTIQKLAGHSSSKTTEIYTKVSKSTLKNLPIF